MAQKSRKSRSPKDLDPKGAAKQVKGGDDRENLNNSYNNITQRDVPNVVRAGTMGVVRFKPGEGITLKP